MKTLLNGYLAYIYNCKSHLYQVIYNWLLKSLIIYIQKLYYIDNKNDNKIYNTLFGLQSSSFF